MTKSSGYVYILQSVRNNTYCIGSAIDVDKRLMEHNLGTVTYTKNLRPLILKFSQKYDSIKEARRVEYKLKKLKNRNIIEQIILDKKIKILGR